MKLVTPCTAGEYREAAVRLAASRSPKIVVEVGVYAGALSRMLARLPSLERLFVIDSWDGSYSKFGSAHMDRIAAGVIAWGSSEPKVEVRRQSSVDASKKFADGSIDFFHTDGDHSLEGIRGDIAAWAPKVRIGGVLSGDNYEIPEVASGVNEFFADSFDLLAHGRLWWAVRAS